MSGSKPNKDLKEGIKTTVRGPQRARGKKVSNLISGVSGFSVATFAQSLPDPYRNILSVLSPVLTAFMAGLGPFLLALAKKEGRNLGARLNYWRFDRRIKSEIKKYKNEVNNCNQNTSRKDEFQKIIDELEKAQIDNAKESVDILLGDIQARPSAEMLRNVPR